MPELAGMPAGVYDGELVAFRNGEPYFPDVCARILNGDCSIPLVYVIFDVLEHRKRSLLDRPYRERRAILQRLNLDGSYWKTSPSFEDGEALFQVACERELEGVVAKRLDGRYRPGEREWVKTKNRAYWRYELEREGAIASRRRR